MYFIHNKYDENSIKELASLDKNVIVVDFYDDPERFRLIKGLKQIPCYLEKLEFDEESMVILRRMVSELSTELEKTKTELTEVKERQGTQETLLIECFTDLDASLNGGDDNATAEPVAME